MKALVLICLALLSIACNRLEEGVVTTKQVEPARDYLYMMPIYHSTGKSGFYTFIPLMMHDDEDYRVSIVGVTDGETLEETFYVSRAKYECLAIGSRFKVDSDCSTEPNDDTEK